MIEKQKAIGYLDLSNISHRYKKEKIDYIKLREYISTQYELLRITAYGCIDTHEQNQRNFITYLSNNKYCCEIVDININTNCDLMLATDLCNDSNIHNHKIVCLIGCDGDFSYPLAYLKKCGYFVHIFGSRNNTSLHLLAICDKITYLEDIEGVIESK